MLRSLVAREILQLLEKKPRLTAELLADALGTSKQYIHNTLRVLSDLELVETPSRGVYVITKEGVGLLQTFQTSEEK